MGTFCSTYCVSDDALQDKVKHVRRIHALGSEANLIALAERKMDPDCTESRNSRQERPADQSLHDSGNGQSYCARRCSNSDLLRCKEAVSPNRGRPPSNSARH